MKNLSIHERHEKHEKETINFFLYSIYGWAYRQQNLYVLSPTIKSTFRAFRVFRGPCLLLL